MSWNQVQRDICRKCNKPVYHNEAKLGAGSKWHTLCFKCTTCSKMLESTTVTEHDGHLYCKSCHGKNFGMKGYGYGVGAGVLSTDAGAAVNSQAQPRKTTNDAGISGAVVEGGCPRCGKRVYDAEKRLAIGQKWHSSCFTCAKCNTTLDSTKISDNEGEIYCKGCHMKLFGPKGVGYGLGAGTLQTN